MRLFLLHLTSLATALRPPRLSWEKVGDLAFFHGSVMNALTLSDSDAAILSRFPCVTLEKWQGCNSTPGCYHSASPPASCPTQQDGTLAVAAQLKALDPTIWVASWLDSLRIYEPIHSLNPDFRDISYQSCVRPAASRFLDTHPAYLLPNASGAPAQESYLNAHVFDHRQEGVRALWRDVCLNLTATGLIDGCGADASQQAYTYVQGVNASVGAAWEAGRNWTLGNTTAAIAPRGGYVLGKLEFELGAYTNGVLQEGCNAGNDTINVLRAAAAASLRHGTPYLYECHSNGEMDDLASFLLGAFPGAFWGFGGWVQAQGGFAGRWLPIFEQPLGAPAADAAYDAASRSWSRAFAHAHVTFDFGKPVGHRGDITFY